MAINWLQMVSFYMKARIHRRNNPFHVQNSEFSEISGAVWGSHQGFAGWISTGKNEIKFIFEPFGYNYGFDIEWRCVPESVPDIRETAIIETEIMILRGVKRGLAPNYIYYDFPQKVLNWNQTRQEPIRTINNLFDPKLTDQAWFQIELLTSFSEWLRAIKNL